MNKKIAIQGVKGSFHHIVANQYFGNNIELNKCLTFDEMPKLLLNNQVDFLVMAIENSIAGAILANYKLIDQYDLTIIGEEYLPIQHQLTALDGQKIEDIKEVWSHPMAINQCRVFLRKYPNIKLIEANDTAEVARLIQTKNLKGIAAIASVKAATIYNLNIIAKNIQTNPENYTRFFILTKEEKKATKFNKVSLKFITKHQQGSLVEVLQIFTHNKLNLSKIQSLPIENDPWQYAFFADVIFDNENQFNNALKEIKQLVSEVKILGKYIKANLHSPHSSKCNEENMLKQADLKSVAFGENLDWSPSNRLSKITEYYFSTKLKEIASLKKQGKPIINLGIGSPDLAPPKQVIEAISKAIAEEDKHSYQSYQGLPEFRKAVADFYQSNYQVIIDPLNEVLPLMGSKEGIMHISMAFLNTGDQVLIPNPGYVTYTSVTKLLDATPVFYDLCSDNNWQPDFKALEKIDLTKVKLMWINYPNMPTGAKATKSLFEKLISFARKHQILLVNDNPYSFILNDNPLSILSVKGAKDVAIELNSLSKTFNIAGWRVGMVLGKSAYLSAVLKVKSNMDSGMFYGIQKGAITALQLDNNWFDYINSIYNKRRKIVWKILDKLNCKYDTNTVGLFVWAKTPNKINSEIFTDELLYNKNIFITPGTIFGTNNNEYIRVSLCVSEEKLNEVLRRIE